MLGTANAVLLRMLIQLEASLASVLAERPAGAEQLAVVTRGIEVALRLSMQVHRFSHLRQVLTEAREAAVRLSGPAEVADRRR
jgi:hypothetical protein